MDRIINMIIRQVIRQFVNRGVNAAMKAGGDAVDRRRSRKAQQRSEAAEPDPQISERRQRHPDERKGDEILYPTDSMTDDMQPRR